MIVLDASAAIEFLLKTGLGQQIEGRLLSPQEAVHAPHLLDIEIAHVLRRQVGKGVISDRRAQDALEYWLSVEVTRHEHDSLLERVWALRPNLTAYDACYVALAEALDAPLVTCDRRLGSSSGHFARVEVLAYSA